MTREAGRQFALLLVATLTVMSTVIIAPAMPRMAEAFAGVAHAELLTKLVLTMPALCIVFFAPIAGAIIDRFGRVRLLIASMLLYGGAGSAGYLLDDLHAILASRALLGIAIGGTMTTMTTLAGDYFQGEARNRFASLQSFVMSAGAVIGVGLGGVLAEMDWRLPFLLYLFGWGVVPAAMKWLDEPSAARRAADREASSTPTPVGRIALVYLTSFFAVSMFYLTPVQIPFLNREIGIMSASLSGLPIALSSLMAAAGSIAYPRLRHRFSFLGIYAIAFALMGAGYGLIWLLGSYAAIIVGMLISGAGVGLFFPNSNLWVLALAPPAARGTLSGGLTAAIFLGQFFSPVLSQPAIAYSGVAGAFGVFAVAMAGVALVFALMPRSDVLASRA